MSLMAFGEAENVVDLSMAPGVDQLVFVTDNGEVSVFPKDVLEKLFLAVVGILVFVDENIAEPALDLVANKIAFGKKGDRRADEIVEVANVLFFFAHVVVVADRAHVRGEFLIPNILGHAFPGMEILVCLHNGFDGIGVGRIAVAFFPAQAHELLDVVFVENGPVSLPAELAAIVAQYARTEGVEDGDRIEIEQASDPLLHFSGRFVGKGERKDLARHCEAGSYE